MLEDDEDDKKTTIHQWKYVDLFNNETWTKASAMWCASLINKITVFYDKNGMLFDITESELVMFLSLYFLSSSQ